MTKWLVITRFLGEKDAAFAALEKAFVGRARIVDINVDPVFDNLPFRPTFYRPAPPHQFSAVTAFRPIFHALISLQHSARSVPISKWL